MFNIILRRSIRYNLVNKSSRNFAVFQNDIQRNLQTQHEYPYIPPEEIDNPISFEQIIANEIGNKTIKHANEAGLPYNFKGVKNFEKMERKFDELVLNKKNIDMNKLQKQLTNYFIAYYKGLITNNDEDFPYMETNFYIHVKKALSLLNKSGIKLNMITKEDNFKSKGFTETLDIFERFHILGLNLERGMNWPLEKYEVFRREEKNGFLGYGPKIEETYGLDLPKEDIAEYYPSDGKILNKPYKQFILRLYVQYKSPYAITYTQDGKEISPNEDYTYNHVATFENQLRLPPAGAGFQSNFLQWYLYFII